MDYPGNNNRSSSPPNPSAKKKRKKSTTAAARRAAATSEEVRFARTPAQGRPDCLLPPAPYSGPNNMIHASNPFDDNPATMSAGCGDHPYGCNPHGPPHGRIDYMKQMRAEGLQPKHPQHLQHQQYQQYQQHQQYQQSAMQVNYASMASSGHASMPRMPQNFGHMVGPMFNEPMSARLPGAPLFRFPRANEPPSYQPRAAISEPINTLSRMHMSMGNVNVSQPVVNDPDVNLHLSGIAQAHPMPVPGSNQNKRKAGPYYGEQAAAQPNQSNNQSFPFGEAPQIHNRPAASELPLTLASKPAYPQARSMGPPPASSILQNQLTRSSNCSAPAPLTLEQQNPNAVPTPCGGCEFYVYPNEEAVMCRVGCKFWYHRECSGLTETAHYLLLANAYARWVCDLCFTNKEIPLITFSK